MHPSQKAPPLSTVGYGQVDVMADLDALTAQIESGAVTTEVPRSRVQRREPTAAGGRSSSRRQ